LQKQKGAFFETQCIQNVTKWNCLKKIAQDRQTALEDENKKITSASARRISTNAEVQLKLCATLSVPFSRATSPSLIVCFYLAYSKLLKLTATSNARGV